jgi:predicted RecA/RadA family phage recombinase
MTVQLKELSKGDAVTVRSPYDAVYSGYVVHVGDEFALINAPKHGIIRVSSTWEIALH